MKGTHIVDVLKDEKNEFLKLTKWESNEIMWLDEKINEHGLLLNALVSNYAHNTIRIKVVVRKIT